VLIVQEEQTVFMAIALIILFLLVGPAALLWGRQPHGRRRAQAAGDMRLFGVMPVALRRAVSSRERIVIRLTRSGDDRALARLAELADRPAPPSPLLLAEADGSLIAALSTCTGEAILDPFVASDDVVALLRLRAAQLDRAA
jgi:hypothetical protein